MLPKDRTNLLIFAIVAAIVLLSITSAYSTYVSATNRHNSCVSRNLTLDTLHDVLDIATTPPPGRKLTPDQVRQTQRFRDNVFARIDRARC